MTLTNLGSWNYIAPPKYTVFDRVMTGIFVLLASIVAGYLIGRLFETIIWIGTICFFFFLLACLGSWVIDR